MSKIHFYYINVTLNANNFFLKVVTLWYYCIFEIRVKFCNFWYPTGHIWKKNNFWPLLSTLCTPLGHKSQETAHYLRKLILRKHLRILFCILLRSTLVLVPTSTHPTVQCTFFLTFSKKSSMSAFFIFFILFQGLLRPHSDQ